MSSVKNRSLLSTFIPIAVLSPLVVLGAWGADEFVDYMRVDNDRCQKDNRRAEVQRANSNGYMTVSFTTASDGEKPRVSSAVTKSYTYNGTTSSDFDEYKKRIRIFCETGNMPEMP
jgi:hypothetical protein